ncbi:hypothetical protein K6W16_12735 [Burkholderia dolosa]|uniref:hypothetical protein n=1 Tax=Burkholderia TaxID=32008 RepID=UPI0002F7A837|nr:MULTISPECIES: hypothetical protein [Burkholderia]AKE01572.1 hypothetical protein XM57_00280 [Burkholderia cepacia]MBR8419330.1 hypothetical protein [Burkholderia dolosa]MBY4657355.1 hypothetical protein [Burkholderia dolosa]MBY4688116.1 hypothetical protein [Burkholderia dolosa]MBY4781278.1 hypothetical protein [Burkholderia dolosa]
MTRRFPFPRKNEPPSRAFASPRPARTDANVFWCSNRRNVDCSKLQIIVDIAWAGKVAPFDPLDFASRDCAPARTPSNHLTEQILAE